MEIHYKCTTWCKLKFPDGIITKEEIIKQLNEGALPLDIAYLDPNFDVEWEIINETEEFMSAEENDGQSTIELYNNITEGPIWDNSYESEIKRNLK